MLHHIANSVSKKGKERMVEGVGFLQKGKDMFSGVCVLDEQEETNILF